MVQIGSPEGLIRFALPSGDAVEVCKVALAQRASFFAPLADECGEAVYSQNDLQHVYASLAPGARQAVPALLRAIGGTNVMPSSTPCLDSQSNMFSSAMLVHSFAVAHFLGSADIMEAARHWASVESGRRLVGAMAALDTEADAASLRTAAEYGLDKDAPMQLLHAAAEADAAEAAKVLVLLGDSKDGEHSGSAGDTVDVLDRHGRTPLHICAIRDSAGVAKVLLEYSASLEALCDPPQADSTADLDLQADASMSGDRPSGLRTALHLAAYHDSVEVLQLLLEAKANVACCVKGVPGAVTPLHECAAADAARAAEILARRAVAIREAELDKPCDQAGDDSSKDIGNEAIQDQDAPEEVQWCHFGDPLHAKVDPHGSTPLHLAAENNAAGVVSALLAARADPAMGDNQGDSAVHCAVLYGSPKALGALLASGVSPALENQSGELPLHLIAEFGPGGDDAELPPPLEKRHFARSVQAMDLLLQALSSHGTLSSALAHRAQGDLQNSALHAVARWDHLGAQEAVRRLAAARADLDAKNGEDRTPLAVALRRYGAEGKVATMLRDLGATPPAADASADFARALGGCVRPLFPPAQTVAAGAGGLPILESQAMEVDQSLSQPDDLREASNF